MHGVVSGSYIIFCSLQMTIIYRGRLTLKYYIYCVIASLLKGFYIKFVAIKSTRLLCVGVRPRSIIVVFNGNLQWYKSVVCRNKVTLCRYSVGLHCVFTPQPRYWHDRNMSLSTLRVAATNHVQLEGSQPLVSYLYTLSLYDSYSYKHGYMGCNYIDHYN